MDAQLVELATQIARQQAYLQAGFWIALAAMVVMGLYVRHLLKGYGNKVGEIKAQTDNLDEIKRQLGETTRVAEEIKSDFGLKDWRERERLTLYRDRMERLLSAVYELQSECTRHQGTALDESELRTNEEFGNRVQVLAALYFPTLRLLALELGKAALTACHHAKLVNHRWRLYRLRVAAEPNAPNQAQRDADYNREYEEGAAAMHASYAALLAKAAEMEGRIGDLIPQYIP